MLAWAIAWEASGLCCPTRGGPAEDRGISQDEAAPRRLGQLPTVANPAVQALHEECGQEAD